MNNNLVWYIENYKDKSIEDYPLNEIDALIFSQLTYLDFKGIVTEEIKFIDTIDLILEKNHYGYCIATDNAIECVNQIKRCNSIRYNDIILRKYSYSKNKDYQFGAIIIEVPNKFLYVNYEGTDMNMSGWKEDFMFTYMYPTKSEELGIKYLNDILWSTKLPVIITGHSKGGHIAVTSYLGSNFLLRNKIKKVYSFDGPGVLEKQYKSLKYKLLKKKILNIIPDNSIVGAFMYQDNQIVIKSNVNGVMQHSALTWQIDDNYLKRVARKDFSIRFEIAFEKWIERYSNDDRKIICDTIFGTFEENNIDSLNDLGNNKFKTLIKLIRLSRRMDKTNKKFVIGCLYDLFILIRDEVIDSKKTQIKDKLNNILTEFKIFKSDAK